MLMHNENTGVSVRQKREQLMRLLAPFKLQLIFASILAIIVSIITVGQPLVIVQIVNSILLSSGSTTRWLLVLLVLLIVEFCVDLWQSRIVELTGVSVLYQIRKDLINQIFGWSTRKIRNYRSGDSIALLTNDVNSIRELVSSGLITLLSSLLTIALSIGVLCYLDAILFLVCLAVLGITLAVITGTISLIAIATERQNAAVSALVTKFEETITNITTISAFNIRPLVKTDLMNHAQSALVSGKKIASYDALLGPILTLASNVSFIVILGFGGVRVANGSLGIAEFISFVLYFGMLIAPIIGGIQTLSAIQKAMGAATRLAAVLEQDQTEVHLEPQQKHSRSVTEIQSPISTGTEVLRLANVSFEYAKGKGYILRDLNISICAGDRVAVMGPSGVGKTTLLHLLAGLEQPSSGEVISTGGENLVVAFVEQDPAVFSGTIRHNLSYGLSHQASDKELWEVLNVVGLAQLIRGLPDQLDAVIADKGTNFSGGEKQRMAIARAILFEAPLLILDEPTSNLDDANEELLIAALDSLKPETTVVFVTHSPLLAERATKVINLEAAL